MSDPDFSTPISTPAATTELGELKAQCAELRAQAQTLRLAVFIMAAAVGAYFWLEVVRNGKALQALRPQAMQVIEAAKVQDPIANRFIGQLVEYSKGHADFGAVLNKYGIRAAPTLAAPAATLPVAPSPVAPAKK